jgi:Domain of unknown function (DUF4350)
MSRAAQAVRSWRWPVVAALAVVAAGAVVALLQPTATGYLDPSGTAPSGGRALADLLTARGQHVLRTAVPVDASPGSNGTRELELVTSPDLLTPAQLAQAGRFQGDILLIDPDPAALRALAPGIRLTGNDPAQPTNPECTAQPAALAGGAYLGGAVLRTDDPTAQACYPGRGGYHLIRYADGTRTISVLSSGAPLSNAYLAKGGDAALALNLLRTAAGIVWLVPSPSALPTQATSAGQQSFFALVPWPAYLIVIQLGVAVLLAAAWRARRLGPLVAERLPVIVRASETVEGHGRLYQSLRARDRAAVALRKAASDRIARLTHGQARPDTIAARAGQAPGEVNDLLYGPPPASDDALVTLAADLDTLERKIRQS